jgi:hypothetical protein
MLYAVVLHVGGSPIEEGEETGAFDVKHNNTTKMKCLQNAGLSPPFMLFTSLYVTISSYSCVDQSKK